MAVLQDLVLKKWCRLCEDNQIDIPPEATGQIRLYPESFAAGDCLFRSDRQIEIAALAIPSCCH
jgi:hypothetical protein